MAPINVLLTGLPGCTTTQRLLVSDTSLGLPAPLLHSIISSATGLPHASFYLLSNGRLATSATTLAAPGDNTAFVHLSMRRALPGGKGGFGATIRGKPGGVRTDNFGACRDLHGRRLRDVQDEARLVEYFRNRENAGHARQQQQQQQQTAVSNERKRGRMDAREVVSRDDVGTESGLAVEVVLDEATAGVQEAVRAGLNVQKERKRARVGLRNDAEREEQGKAFQWADGFEHEWPSGSDSDESAGGARGACSPTAARETLGADPAS